MGKFSADISKFIDKVERGADLVVRKLAIDVTESVKTKTPVDTGDLRGSWTVSINGLPATYNGDVSGNMSVKFGDTWFISTNKAYAPIVEYGLYPNPPKNPTGKTVNGYSKQAPQGMVRITVQEAKNKIKGWKF